MAAGIGRIISRQIGLIGLIGLIGCSGPSFDYVGQWSGTRDIPKKPGGDPAIHYTISKVDLHLKPSGEFDLYEGGVPKTGSYRVGENKAYLKVKTFMGQPIERQGELAVKMNKEIELTPQADGSLLYSDPAGLTVETIRLHRQKPEAQPRR